MNESTSVTRVADQLMQGPRGRRLLLEVAMASEQFHAPEEHEDSLRSAVFLASYHLESGTDTAVSIFEYDGSGLPEMDVAEVARRLAPVHITNLTPALIRSCLIEATDSARYWQEPDGTDVLAARSDLQDPLRMVAEQLASSEFIHWWSEPVDIHDQWRMSWDDDRPQTAPVDLSRFLSTARDQLLEEEHRAEKERPSDLAALWGGTWWSCPPFELPATTRNLWDGKPAGLWFVEDSLGWEQAKGQRMAIPPGLRIFEIGAAEASWRDLSLRFPIEVTHSKKHEWYRTTGKSHTWIIPDWAQVAQEYDGIHLPVLTYLATAGAPIPLADQVSSLIAGWDPDKTFWFSQKVQPMGATSHWHLEDDGYREIWNQEQPDEKN